MKIAERVHVFYVFPKKKIWINFDKKSVWATLWAIFFTNSSASGHPAREIVSPPPPDCRFVIISSENLFSPIFKRF
jgi:hypothetical protein